MAMALSSRSRLIRRLPRPTVFSALELALLSLIAIQAARLVWTLVTPVAPVGDWTTSALVAPADGGVLGAFDPFFRLSDGGGQGVVTSLNLKLYGVREDRATGRGSAIIALGDESQQSFAVGDEIMPGVTLAEVGFDSVTISRNGALEQIFLDQSEPARPLATAAAAPAAPAAAPPAPAPNSQIRFEPRISGGQVSGLAVSPGSDGGYALRAAGLAAGDVIVSINGQRITSLGQARTLVRQAGGEVSVVVNRGGRAVPLRMSLDL